MLKIFKHAGNDIFYCEYKNKFKYLGGKWPLTECPSWCHEQGLAFRIRFPI